MSWRHEPYRHGLSSRGIRTSSEVIITKPTKFHVRIVSKKLMGDYICLHGLLPDRELPIHLRGKIPTNQIWMRVDAYKNPKQRDDILQHEKLELELMLNKGMTYKDAHRTTNRRMSEK